MKNTFGIEEQGEGAITSGNKTKSVRKQKRSNYCFSRRHKLTGKFPPSLPNPTPFSLPSFLPGKEIAAGLSLRGQIPPRAHPSHCLYCDFLSSSAFPGALITFKDVKVPFFYRLHAVYRGFTPAAAGDGEGGSVRPSVRTPVRRGELN